MSKSSKLIESSKSCKLCKSRCRTCNVQHKNLVRSSRSRRIELVYSPEIILTLGKTLHNFSQPELWADLNVGLDTSALEPLQVNTYDLSQNKEPISNAQYSVANFEK